MRKEGRRFLVVETVHLSDFGPLIQNHKDTSLRVIQLYMVTMEELMFSRVFLILTNHY